MEKKKYEGYVHYFDWEIYLIIVIAYGFGFAGGWIRAWMLPVSLLFLAIPFWKYNAKKTTKHNN